MVAFLDEFHVRHGDGYGLNDARVDSWSKVRNLKCFSQNQNSPTLVETRPNGRGSGGLSRIRQSGKNVDKTECCAQVSRMKMS